NNAHVYKRHDLVSKDECVRIPDGSDIYNAAFTEEEILEPAADISAGEAPTEELKPAEAQAKTHVVAGDSEHQTEAKRQRKKASGTTEENNTADKEALALIYKKELEALSKAAAEAAAQSAYFDALNKKKSELKECISDVQRLLNQLTQKQEDFIEQYTNELKYMAIEIAEKMILEKISADDAILQKLVMQNVRAVKSAEWISVELSERLVGLVDYVKRELETPEFKARTSVYAVPENADTCRVTTEEGTIVSTISVQANNLRKAFKEADKQ
ncbi:MAG: hypothetical protein VB064_13445, partial [Oscillospiraceae bacterium]|nr:hypothetical protein [Oscillospiraceae bacterium]